MIGIILIGLVIAGNKKAAPHEEAIKIAQELQRMSAYAYHQQTFFQKWFYADTLSTEAYAK